MLRAINLCIGYSDATVIFDHETISGLYGMMSYCANFTGEDLSHVTDEDRRRQMPATVTSLTPTLLVCVGRPVKTESVGFRKA